ncbi:hypothetical protein, partial [Streptomyces sp. NPDC006855]|uniref:hypothetical protein n=1 Tax=Streptomyces sp. NPDC006855 TaxID=3364765 RepID=UPI003683867D
MQDEQDALEHQPVRMPLAPKVPGPTLNLRQQWLDHRPQFIVDFPWLRPRHPAPPDRQFRIDPTTSKIISLGVLRACRESTRRFDLVLVEVEESRDVSRCAEAGGR